MVVEACELVCETVVVPCCVEVSFTVVVAGTVLVSAELCDLLDVPATVGVCGTVVESTWLLVCTLLLLSTRVVVSCPKVEAEAEAVVCFIVDG